MASRLELLNQMLLKEPGDPFLNYAMALEFHKGGEKQKAIALLENIIRVDANYLAAYYQLGKFYEEISEKNKSIEIYQKGIFIAQAQKNMKTLSELREALQQIEE